VLTGSVIRADPIGRSLTYEDILRDTATQGERDFDLSSNADSKSVQGHASDNLSERSWDFSGTTSSKHSQAVTAEIIHSADEFQQLTKDQGLIRNLLQNMNSEKFKMTVSFVYLSFIFTAGIGLLLFAAGIGLLPFAAGIGLLIFAAGIGLLPFTTGIRLLLFAAGIGLLLQSNFIITSSISVLKFN